MCARLAYVPHRVFVVRTIYKSKLCFELFCRIYDLPIVVVRSPYFIHSLGSFVQFCRTDDDCSLHWTCCFLGFIQCTTRTDDNSVGLWDILFRFCAHILYFFSSLFRVSVCNNVAVQLVQRQRRKMLSTMSIFTSKLESAQKCWFYFYNLNARIFSRRAIQFCFNNFRHQMPWCAAWNSILYFFWLFQTSYSMSITVGFSWAIDIIAICNRNRHSTYGNNLSSICICARRPMNFYQHLFHRRCDSFSITMRKMESTLALAHVLWWITTFGCSFSFLFSHHFFYRCRRSLPMLSIIIVPILCVHALFSVYAPDE